MCIGEVDVVEGEAAARRQLGARARRARLFGERPGDAIAAPERQLGGVVGPDDGDGNVLGDLAAVLVVERDRVDLGDRLSRCQLLDQSGLDGVGPLYLAGPVAVGIVQNDRTERPQSLRGGASRLLECGGNGMLVAQVGVGEGQNALDGEELVAWGRPHDFIDNARCRARAEYRRVIGHDVLPIPLKYRKRTNP